MFYVYERLLVGHGRFCPNVFLQLFISVVDLNKGNYAEVPTKKKATTGTELQI